MTSSVLRLLAAAAVVLSTAAPAVVRAQSPASPFPILDVPYVPQSLELCGGAAAAMVMRYWGATGVYAESFQDLVDERAGGIRGADLMRALQERGWQALSFAGDPPLIRRSLEDRRPPIVLIEDQPDRFHYVVIVGWQAGRVVLHDPARAPFRIMDEDAFVGAWRRSGFWTLLALPDAGTRAGAAEFVPEARAAADPPRIAAGICGGMVEEGVRLAHAGELDAAHDLLQLASVRCPLDGAPWRELAGVYAVRKEWGRAAVAARLAVARDREDAHAINLLATSLFLDGDAGEALKAWNLMNEPRIDLIDLRGLERIRFAVAAGALGLAPQALLTSDALRRGERRLAALPAVSGARVTYAPTGSGEANVSAGVVERPLMPATRPAMAASALRAAIDREVGVEVASPTGGGELWYGGWRWWDGRPRLSMGLAAPSPLGGVWRAGVSDERQTYGNGSALLEERHRRLGLAISDWATGAFRWQGDVALEQWPGRRAVAVGGALEYRLGGDRLAITTRTGRWVGAPRTWRASTAVLWRSRASHAGTVWLMDAGAEAVGAGAPLALWPGAGTGQGRSPLLRAHPLVHGGVIRDGVLGRRLAHTTVEWRRWSRPLRGVVRFAPAAFVDGARAWGVGQLGDSRGHVDIGGGLRVSIAGTGVLRVDVARGLRDGRTALSVGMSR